MPRKRRRGSHSAAYSKRLQSPSLQPQAVISIIPSVPLSPFTDERVPAQPEGTRNLGKQASGSASVRSMRNHDPNKGLNLKRKMRSYGKINAKNSLEMMGPSDLATAAELSNEDMHIAMIHAMLKNKSWKDAEQIEKKPVYSQLQENSGSNEGSIQIASFTRTGTRSRRKPRQFSSADEAKFEETKEILHRSQDIESLMNQDESYNVVMDGMSKYVEGLGQGHKSTKQNSCNIAMGTEIEELPQNLVAEDQRENKEQARQLYTPTEFTKRLENRHTQLVTELGDTPTQLAKHLEVMRAHQARLEEQAKLLEEMLIFEAQLKAQAKRLEEMHASQAQLRATFQRILQ